MSNEKKFLIPNCTLLIESPPSVATICSVVLFYFKVLLREKVSREEIAPTSDFAR